MINIPPMAERIKKRREYREMRKMTGKIEFVVTPLPIRRSIWNLWGLL